MSTSSNWIDSPHAQAWLRLLQAGPSRPLAAFSDQDKAFLIRALAMHAALTTPLALGPEQTFYDLADGYVFAIDRFIAGSDHREAATSPASISASAESDPQNPAQASRSSQGDR